MIKADCSWLFSIPSRLGVGLLKLLIMDGYSEEFSVTTSSQRRAGPVDFYHIKNRSESGNKRVASRTHGHS